METWQRDHITKNLTELSELTILNWDVKAELFANKILGKADVEKLDAFQNQNSEASYHCYLMIMGRKEAYEVITRTLIKFNQTGAARILLEVVPNSKLFTYLGPSIKLDGFKDAEIELHGITFKLHELFPCANYAKLCQIFQDTINVLDYYDSFVTKQKIFELAKNTIPPKPPFYVSRLISNRIKLDKSIFKADGPDVFVFKNNMNRYKLSQLAKPHPTASSSSQQTHITARFIYLEENEDWISLKHSAKPKPIHLIKYEADQNIFILEDTSAVSDILWRVGSQKEGVYISEDSFVQQQLSEDIAASSICICDTPGMGKTFLLANIARLMLENNLKNETKKRIIVFIPLTTFANNFSQYSPNINVNPEAALLTILKYTSHNSPQLLLNLINAKLLLLEIFFDGFDEVSAENLLWMKLVFKSITSMSPTVTIYISSRPHMRQQLEKSLNVLSYDILPFKRDNQVDFLVQFWSQNDSNVDQISLQNYATNCLEAVIQSLTTNDKEITGIPLLCQLIAVVYANKAKAGICSTKKRRVEVSKNISQMFKEFVELRINLVAKNPEELNFDKFDDIKLVHIWHALKLHFLDDVLQRDAQFKDISSSTMVPEILKVGILQGHSKDSLHFTHRTFAEYLVAEHFSTKLQEHEMNFDATSMLDFVLKCRTTKRDSVFEYSFKQPVIASFFNSAIGEIRISEKLKLVTAKFISSILPVEFISILCTCCQQNVDHIFFLLKEALTKCDNTKIQTFFTTDNFFELLSVCIRNSTSQMFHNWTQLLIDTDVMPKALFDKRKALELAVECLNYEAVEYFLDKVPLLGMQLLEKCVKSSYDENWDIERKAEILHLLLNQEPSLIQESPNILASKDIHLNLIKILVEFKATQNTYSENQDEQSNYIIHAATYMSSKDYHEFLKYYFERCKPADLLHKNGIWTKTMTEIIKQVNLLPKTLDLLFDVPGTDINMLNKNGNNLAFLAAKGNQLNNLRQLVDRGLDYKAKGSHERSLLHAAAYWGDEDMVRYLLSDLKLDPTPRTKIDATPLHYAVNNLKGLSVAKVLVENGAKIKAKNFEGQTPLHAFVRYSNAKSSDVKIIEYLIEMGLGVNDRDKDGNTPLHFCTYDKKIMKCLRDKGADLNAKNNKGEVPEENFTPALRS